ncbi:MAG: hypothetical protein HC890_18060 [Chloroflexaceae bacterium]|nr:hypothetical protein [Chloroflexaceae bacterium]
MLITLTAQELEQNSETVGKTPKICYQKHYFSMGPVFPKRNRHIAIELCQDFIQCDRQCILAESDWGITVWIEEPHQAVKPKPQGENTVTPAVAAAPLPQESAATVPNAPAAPKTAFPRVYRGVVYTHEAQPPAPAIAQGMVKKLYRGIVYSEIAQVALKSANPAAGTTYQGIAWGGAELPICRPACYCSSR